MSGVVGIPPDVTPETAPFWDAAREGRLVVEQCRACGTANHPPYGICRTCHGRDLAFVGVDGPGTVYSFTVNHQRWMPDLAVPFALVWVDFASMPGVRVVGRLRGCEPADVRIGMRVEVGFEDGPAGFAVPSFVASSEHP